MHQTEKRIADFQTALIVWGKSNFQQFPWRDTDDPYHVLVSEFMLHRTRASQVVPVYEKFIQKYPALDDFSKAELQEVKKHLSPLGLTWRIKNLINALHELYETYREVPVDYEKLITIRGIGPYIAGATVCFSKNAEAALIDTNTLRVIGRYWGYEFDENSRRKKNTEKIISTVTNSISPKYLYYSIIDLAHQVCLSGEPICKSCPLKTHNCIYLEQLFDSSKEYKQT